MSKMDIFLQIDMMFDAYKSEWFWEMLWFKSVCLNGSRGFGIVRCAYCCTWLDWSSLCILHIYWLCCLFFIVDSLNVVFICQIDLWACVRFVVFVAILVLSMHSECDSLLIVFIYLAGMHMVLQCGHSTCSVIGNTQIYIRYCCFNLVVP